MKKLIVLFLAALMLCSALPMAAFGGRFLDVPDGKWYSEGISFCAANGYMDGVAEGKFDRQSDLTRAMFMTILAKVDGVDLSEYTGRSNFYDVKIDGWYTGAIEWAVLNRITDGIGKDSEGRNIFGYKNPITREQMALFFYVYSEYVNAKNAPDEIGSETEPHIIDLTPRADLTGFEDVDRTHSWARDAMEWAVAVGLVSGTGENILSPRGNCSRAEAAVMLRAYVLGLISDCEHEWVDATCLEMGYCTKCELKPATELGHDFGERICTESVKCSRCDVMSETSAHVLTRLTCTTPSLCTVCGYIETPASGHNMYPASCTIPATCLDCNMMQGEPLGHTTSYGICDRCRYGVFPSVHDEHLFYLNDYGYTFNNGLRGLYSDSRDQLDSGAVYREYVYFIPGQTTIYLELHRFDYNTGRTDYVKIELADCNKKYYNFYFASYDDKRTYYSLTGAIDTANYDQGNFILYGYNGSENMRETAMNMVSFLLPKAPRFCQGMLNSSANIYSGMMKAYGLGNFL